MDVCVDKAGQGEPVGRGGRLDGGNPAICHPDSRGGDPAGVQIDDIGSESQWFGHPDLLER